MEAVKKTILNVEATVNAPIEKVWNYWSLPEHITKWNQASDDWYCPKSENDLRTGGKFSATMAAKDGSFSFDFYGEYDEVKKYELIAYTLGDGRKVKVIFSTTGHSTKIEESFEAEDIHSLEMQQAGWQAILNNFKTYTENN